MGGYDEQPTYAAANRDAIPKGVSLMRKPEIELNPSRNWHSVSFHNGEPYGAPFKFGGPPDDLWFDQNLHVLTESFIVFSNKTWPDVLWFYVVIDD